MSLPSKPDPIYVNCADHIHGTRYQVQTLVPVMIYIQEDSENNIHVVPPGTRYLVQGNINSSV